MRWIALAAALALAPAARADEPPRLGLLVDAGFPEGLSASAVYRPTPSIRFWAGPAWNAVAWGAQGGVTVIPWHLGLSPLLSVEGGRYFSADASFLARNASGIPEELSPLLRDVSYDYLAVHVGVELGTRDAFAVSLRAGLSRVSLTARGTAEVRDDASGTTVTFTDPRLVGTLPSVKLGLQLWF